eukprot:scaffold2418_cov115-Isochrysis_galbana.AAC.1
MRAHLFAEIGSLAGKVVGNPSGHPGIVAYRDLVVGHRVGGGGTHASRHSAMGRSPRSANRRPTPATAVQQQKL